MCYNENIYFKQSKVLMIDTTLYNYIKSLNLSNNAINIRISRAKSSKDKNLYLVLSLIRAERKYCGN